CSLTSLFCVVFIILISLPPISTLFPYTTLFRSFWCVIDLVESTSSTAVGFSQYGSDCSGQRCFTMVNVADSTDVNVRFCTFKLRSEEHTSELQSRENLVCRLLLEKKKNNK